MAQQLQDTIDLELTREHTVVNETVKVVAHIAALVTAQDDAALRAELRDTMNRLIAGAEWQFSNMNRATDATGIERLTVTATARVSEKENSNLDGRAKQVSRPGLTISGVSVDTSIPRAQLDKAAADLRVELLTAAKEEAIRLSAVFAVLPGSDGAYRVHSVNFHSGGGFDISNNRGQMKAMIAATSYGTGFGGSDDDALGNAQKITMSANVRLARTA